MAMREEELYESEVLWPEPEASHDDEAPGCRCSSSSSVAPPPWTPVRRGWVPEEPRYPGGSRPVDVPKPARSTWRRDDGDNGGRGGTMVPPHELVSRRRSSQGPAEFALRSGPGRARRLNHLRDSVLRMTGYIEG